MDKPQQSQAERSTRLGHLQLTIILTAIAFHAAIALLAPPLYRDTVHIVGILDLILAAIVVLTFALGDVLLRSPRGSQLMLPLPADTQRLSEMTHVLSVQVAEQERELVASQQALARENEERTFIEAKLERASTLDPLTGLLKRSSFIALLEQQRIAEPGFFAVYFIDIDHFKMINDSLGDDFADRVLVAIADRLAHLMPTGGLLGRVGGDEYAVSCSVSDEAAGGIFGERIRAILTEPIAIDNQRLHLQCSIGSRISTDRLDGASSLLRDAHTAMHRAKFGGRARLVLFETSMRDEIENRFALTSDLRQAVIDCQFFVEYQPIHDLLEGRIIAYEALARWEHPNRGRVEPGVFISAAEDNGLVAAIGEQVLEDACKQIAARKLGPGTPIGINVSARQLVQPDLCESIARTLATYQIDPLCVLLEVTESTIVESLSLARGILLRLKELGLRLAIDDFGTGYSSLSYLRSLPFDVLKIDRSFVRNIDTEKHSRDIVQMIVTLAESLDLSVVAEGIETEAQLQTLRELGCYRGQGYYFSRPLPAEEAFNREPVILAGFP